MAKKRGREAFVEYYEKFFGKEELGQLFKALEVKQAPVLFFLKKDEELVRELWNKSGLTWETSVWHEQALEWPIEVQVGEKLPGYEEGLLFPMNKSSLLPPLAMDVKEREQVLDACAAPGGKGLVLYEQLQGSATLVLNDMSPKRRIRMKQMLEEFGVDQAVVTPYKSELLHQHFPECFDKILVDAPCSSEKHVWNSSKYLAQWSENRVKGLQKRQINLVKQLWLALKPGGRLVYSTCAITPEENEAVVEAVLGKLGESATLVDIEGLPKVGEEGMKGDWNFDVSKVRRVWSHKEEGLDPMFVAVLEKG